MWKRLAILTALAIAACGGDEGEKTTTVVTVEPTPRDAVAEIKLQLEDFRGYGYCEESYPEACGDLPAAYVLEREGDEPFKVVMFNNQDENSTYAVFDYLTIDMATKTISVEGQYQFCNVCGPTANLDEKGEPKWGIPK